MDSRKPKTKTISHKGMNRDRIKTFDNLLERKVKLTS